jgi:hypothetical protein
MDFDKFPIVYVFVTVPILFVKKISFAKRKNAVNKKLGGATGCPRRVKAPRVKLEPF